MSSSFLCPTGSQGPAGAPDGAGTKDARPVLSAPSDAQVPGHFQSDGDFATTNRWIARAFASNRRRTAWWEGVQIGFAIGAGLGIVLPALCMWLAGGTPA